MEVFDALPPSGITAAGWVLDDDYLVPSLDSEGGTSSLHRLRGEVPELFRVTGELFVVDRVR